MALNQEYWARVFEREFDRQARSLVDVLERRLLPSFEGIEQESEQISNEAWETFMSAPATGDEDPSEFAEAATEMGVEHFMLLSGMRQGIVNMVAASLYHMFEQQLMLFLRRELLQPHEETDQALFNMREVAKRLEKHGIDVTTFPAWSILEELRLAANTIKHAEGPSARSLQKVRPDLFKAPGLPELGQWHLHATRRVFQPLAGQDVYVSVSNLHDYRDAVSAFWQQLLEAMRGAQ